MAQLEPGFLIPPQNESKFDSLYSRNKLPEIVYLVQSN